MRIYVKSNDGKKFTLLFPSCLIFNDITASIGAKALNKHINMDIDLKLNAHDMRKLIRMLNRMRRKYPDMYLVDIESADGDIVKIKL
ncbi:hypothetical protein SDC9_121532 [bioreactor metagenome]|uniref:Uncharacterized protein n=1 Tax=bioreactor metagenome TaxID=1076179 RepID=A0A645CC85_9ZZZZ|nr:hypothetical protein [Oscillospiraceae bacterium]